MRQIDKMLNLIWQKNIHKLTATFLGLLYLSAFCSNEFAVIAQPKYSRYGLDVEIKQTGSLHSVPSYCVVAISPQNGGRTISESPRLYIYLLKRYEDYNTSLPALGFSFRIGADKDFSSRRVYKETVKNLALNEGLYKITLSIVKPPVLNGKVQYWTTNVIDSEGMGSDYARTYIQIEKDANLLREIRATTTLIEKARIYAKYYYWYDAFDAYSQWLESNPADAVARKEWRKMIEDNLSSQCGVRKNFDKFLTSIESKPAQEIKLLPKK